MNDPAGFHPLIHAVDLLLRTLVFSARATVVEPRTTNDA